ncbi:hypothetical protein CCP3SC15_170028 [Gammaproteobacteria bacterium]
MPMPPMNENHVRNAENPVPVDNLTDCGLIRQLSDYPKRGTDDGRISVYPYGSLRAGPRRVRGASFGAGNRIDYPQAPNAEIFPNQSTGI